jgi:hypothetical protein
VPVPPAVLNVPALDATSIPPAVPDPVTVMVYVFVDPEVTEVGPLSVVVVPDLVLWH